MTKKQILLFVGEDITAHLVMNKVVKDVVAKGIYQPVLFFPKGTKLKNADLPELGEFSFFEKSLLNGTVYPFIEKCPPSSPCDNLSPSQLASRFNLEMLSVDNVNDPNFVKEIENRNIACAVSIRCTQIFKPDIISVIQGSGNKPRLFLNLHSGLLPEYRGVMPTLRRMFDIASGVADTREYGFTLHKIDAGIDTGNVIQVVSRDLDTNHSGFLATVNLAEGGAQSIIDVLTHLNNYTHRGYPQVEDKSAYYTFPTQDELRAWKSAGVELFRAEEVIHTLVSAFSSANTNHGKDLVAALRCSISSWYSKKPCRSPGCEHPTTELPRMVA